MEMEMEMEIKIWLGGVRCDGGCICDSYRVYY